MHCCVCVDCGVLHIGLKKDVEEAVRWYSSAAAAGVNESEKELYRLLQSRNNAGELLVRTLLTGVSYLCRWFISCFVIVTVLTNWVKNKPSSFITGCMVTAALCSCNDDQQSQLGKRKLWPPVDWKYLKVLKPKLEWMITSWTPAIFANLCGIWSHEVCYPYRWNIIHLWLCVPFLSFSFLQQ